MIYLGKKFNERELSCSPVSIKIDKIACYRLDRYIHTPVKGSYNDYLHTYLYT